VHYLTDVAVTLAVLAALGVTWFTGWERADPAFALAISGYMLWNSRGIAVDALVHGWSSYFPSSPKWVKSHAETQPDRATALVAPLRAFPSWYLRMESQRACGRGANTLQK
jgi:Co/Zn/Cd efflux system component